MPKHDATCITSYSPNFLQLIALSLPSVNSDKAIAQKANRISFDLWEAVDSPNGKRSRKLKDAYRKMPSLLMSLAKSIGYSLKRNRITTRHSIKTRRSGER